MSLNFFKSWRKILVFFLILNFSVFQFLYPLSFVDEKVSATDDFFVEETVEISLENPEALDSSVAILVDTDTYSSISGSIDTYASTISTTLSKTKTIIIQIDQDEEASKIASILESLYRGPEGLKGVVLIGKVPIPLLDLDGEEFYSLLPYIDFDHKAFVYTRVDSEDKFIKNSFTDINEQPEIWGGIIKPPVSEDAGNYYSLISSYLAKVVDFHNGNLQVDRKITYLDFEAQDLYGKPSGTMEDYLDKSITNILHTGRYDLNFVEKYRNDKEALGECSAGFIPVTMDVVKYLLKIRPYRPSTLRYLTLPLVFIPPIPIPEVPSIPTISLPDVPDISKLVDLTTKLSPASFGEITSNLAHVSSFMGSVGKLNEIASLDVSAIANIQTALSTPMPDPAAVNELVGMMVSVDPAAISNLGSSIDSLDFSAAAGLGISIGNLNSTEIPEPAAFDKVLEELETDKAGDEAATFQDYQMLDDECMDVEVGALGALASGLLGLVDQIGALLLGVAGLIINLSSFGLDLLLNGALGGLFGALGDLAANLNLPEIGADILAKVDQVLSVVGPALNLALAGIQLGLNINSILNGFAGLFSILGDLPALPKLPKIPSPAFEFTIEIPPPNIVLPLIGIPNLPIPPVIDLMKDFYLLPLSLLIPPLPPMPPVAILSKIKSILKIPDFPTIPEIPSLDSIPGLDALLANLDALLSLPDLSLLGEIGSFLSALDLSGLASLLAFDFASLLELASIDIGGAVDAFASVFEVLGALPGLLGDLLLAMTGLDSLVKAIDCVTSMDTRYIRIDFDADIENPQDLETLRANQDKISFAKDLSAAIPSAEDLSSLSSALGDLEGSLGDFKTNVLPAASDLMSMQGDIEMLADLSSIVTDFSAEALPGLDGIVTAVDKFGQLSEMTGQFDQLLEAGDISGDFQEGFLDMMPMSVTQNLDTLENLGNIEMPDVMSLFKLNVTGYIPPIPEMPELNPGFKLRDSVGDDSKTIANQDIWKGLISPTKSAWELLCELEGVESDLDELLVNSSLYNEQNIVKIDREPGMDLAYMDSFWESIMDTPAEMTTRKQQFEQGFTPNEQSEVLILNQKADLDDLENATVINYGDGVTTTANDISSSYSLVDVLYGAPYGDFSQEGYIAGEKIMSSGKTLSVIAFTSLNTGGADILEPINMGESNEFGYGLVNDPFISTFVNGEITLGDALKPYWLPSMVIVGDPLVMLEGKEKNDDNNFSISFGETMNHYKKGSNLILSGNFNNEEDNDVDILAVSPAEGLIQWYRATPSSPRYRFLNESTIYEFEMPENGGEVFRVQSGDFDNNSSLDLVIYYREEGSDVDNYTVLINDGYANFVVDNNVSPSNIIATTDVLLEKDIIAYQKGVSPFADVTRFHKTEGDYDNDGDLDFIFSTEKELQFKENISNNYYKLPVNNNPVVINKTLENYTEILKPIDVKEVVPNDAYVDIEWYPYLPKEGETLIGYNIYFSENRYSFDKMRTIPVGIIEDTLSPSYTLYDLNIDKRIYVAITAKILENSYETPFSEIFSATPRIKLDKEKPLAGIIAADEVLINVINQFDASVSEDNAKLQRYEWDFDIYTDSNGDGIPSNDNDSQLINPEHFFSTLGEYEIALNVIDRNNNISYVTQKIEVVLPDPLILTLKNGLVLFKNEMSPNLKVKYFKETEDEEGIKTEEELDQKYTDANGFVALPLIINVDGSKLIDQESGEAIAFLNNSEDNIFYTQNSYSVKTSFKQTEIIIHDKDNTEEELAKVFFRFDLNQDVQITEDINDILDNGLLNSGVYVQDSDLDDEYKVVFGENGSVRVVETLENSTEKTYNTILHSGGMYLDNDYAYLDLEKEDRREFIFDLKLKTDEQVIAKILMKPKTIQSIIEQVSSEEDAEEEGIYILLLSDVDMEQASDVKEGDKVYAIVGDNIGNGKETRNKIRIRSYQGTDFDNLGEDLGEAGALLEKGENNLGQVLGVSTNRNHQIVEINNIDNIYYLSDNTPTFYGKVNKAKTNIFLSITDEFIDKEIINKEIKTGRIGEWDYIVTHQLDESRYKIKIIDKNNNVLQDKTFYVDRTAPEKPHVTKFDGKKQITGRSESYGYITAYNYDDIFNPTEPVYVDEFGDFEINFSSNTSHFSLKVTDLAGNISEEFEVVYNKDTLLEHEREQLEKEMSITINLKKEEESDKDTELFWGIFILIIGVAAYIYGKRKA